jgi:hypothetical protein
VAAAALVAGASGFFKPPNKPVVGAAGAATVVASAGLAPKSPALAAGAEAFVAAAPNTA